MDPLGFTRLDPATMDAELLRDLQKADQFADQTDYEILQRDRHLVFGKHADMGKPSSSPVSLGSIGSGYTLLVLKSLLSPAEKPHDLPTLLLWLLSTFFLGYALGQSLEDADPEIIMHI